MKRYFSKAGVSQDVLDNLLIYTVFATIVGARLGHVFFYDWAYYKTHIVEIFKPWEGGLASHGAAVVIPFSIYLFARRYKKQLGHSFLWLMDRVVITVAFAGALIRIGNFTNSEIYGEPSNGPFETVFLRPVYDFIQANYSKTISDVEFVETGESLDTLHMHWPMYTVILTPSTNAKDAELRNVFRHLKGKFQFVTPTDDSHLAISKNTSIQTSETGAYFFTAFGVPRAPSQLYESLGYLVIFILLFALGELGHLRAEGRIFGIFMLLVFGFRFVIEFLKANQKAFEADMSLNMGQLLSIPLILAGITLFARTLKPIKNESEV